MMRSAIEIKSRITPEPLAQSWRKTTRLCTPHADRREFSEMELAQLRPGTNLSGLVHRSTKKLPDLHAALRMKGNGDERYPV